MLQVHQEEAPGDILVFLTGQEEIESVERLINEQLKKLPQGSQKLQVVPIFAALPPEQQMRVFAPAPSGFRKVFQLCIYLLFNQCVISGLDSIEKQRKCLTEIFVKLFLFSLSFEQQMAFLWFSFLLLKHCVLPNPVNLK